jgi:antitoxin VapB
MALIIRNKKVEDLARLLADRTGLNMTDAVEEALRARLADMGALPEQVLARLQAIAKTCAEAPDLDTRPVDEILDYDEEGLFGDDR